MDTVKDVVASVSVTLVFLGLAMILMPEGTIKKPFKSFVSITIVAVIVVAVSSSSDALSSIDFDDFNNRVFDTSSAAQNNNEINIRVAQQTVRDIILSELKENGIFDAQVSVSANISDEGVISITETVVHCDLNDIATAKNVLKELGLEPNVYERE